MKVAVCQYGRGEAAAQLALSHETHRAACDAFGYEFIEYRSPLNDDKDDYWQKTFVMQKTLARGYDFVIWLDADAIWLGEKALVPLGVDMIGATRHHNYEAALDSFNCGVLYLNVRNPLTLAFINEWIATPDHGHVWRDQAAFNTLVNTGKYALTQLGHEWNDVTGILSYSSGKRPIVAAWHGEPDRTNRMRRWVQVEVLPKSPAALLQNWGQRKELRRVVELLNAKQVVEVGVYRGEFLEQLSKAQVPDCQFYGIDRWQVYAGYNTNLDCLASEELLSKAKPVAMRRFKNRPDVNLVTAESTDTRGLVDVDLVYIDANHLQQHVEADISAWWPTIRPGGVLAGHDYQASEFPGVSEAVDAFGQANGLELYVTREERYASWAFVKPSD